MIKVENIVKSFGSLTVLKGVTVEIPEKKIRILDNGKVNEIQIIM